MKASERAVGLSCLTSSIGRFSRNHRELRFKSTIIPLPLAASTDRVPPAAGRRGPPPPGRRTAAGPGWLSAVLLETVTPPGPRGRRLGHLVRGENRRKPYGQERVDHVRERARGPVSQPLQPRLAPLRRLRRSEVIRTGSTEPFGAQLSHFATIRGD